ncbi:MAG TPA: LacI family DNA-binding transcriptional regulator [Verrucomicrobiae bacterium]
MDESAHITLKDVAKSAGVSVATVSLALRNHPKIPADHRTAIQETALRMGYRPDPMAAALSYKRGHFKTRAIHAELAWINHWQEPQRLRSYREFNLYWRGAAQAAERHGFRLEEFVVGPKLSFSRLEGILQSRNIQGVLVPPHGGEAVTTPNDKSLNWRQYSVVKFGYSISSLQANVVGSNQMQGAMLAFSEIRKRGYQRIGYVCYFCPGTHCKAGIFLAQADLPPDQRLPIIELNTRSANYVEAFHQWLRAHRPDAILTEVAETRELLERLGIRVPDDIALASISVLDGHADAGIDQNSEEIGRVAAETVIRQIYSHSAGFETCRCETLVDAAWQDGSTVPNLG